MLASNLAHSDTMRSSRCSGCPSCSLRIAAADPCKSTTTHVTSFRRNSKSLTRSRTAATTTSGFSTRLASTTCRSSCGASAELNHCMKASSLKPSWALGTFPPKAAAATSLSACGLRAQAGGVAKRSATRAERVTNKTSSGNRSMPFWLKSKHVNSKVIFSSQVAQHQSVNVSISSIPSIRPLPSLSKASNTRNASRVCTPISSLKASRSTTREVLRWRKARCA
mmetsp:Transcript_100716/g.200088  ORF Transcript_100716/g.200088 Transcript_100716/m.200088 type:complete len:224 (-) Transcript_100716:97-768(-)